MLNSTLVLIVTVALSAIAVIVLGVCLLKNLFRPVMRSSMQLLVALACIPVALLLAKVASAAASDALIGMLTAENSMLSSMIDLQSVQTLLSDLPSSQGAIGGLIQMLVAPFAFVMIYFVLWIVIGIVVGIVVRALEKGGAKLFTYKNKALGAAIGIVCGMVLLVVYLVPLIGFTGIVPQVMDTGILEMTDEKGEPMLEMSEDDKQAILDIVNAPALSVPRTLGGQALFATLTTANLDGEPLSLTAELDNVCTLVTVALPLTQKEITDFNETDVAIIQEQLPAAFENSTLLRVLGAEAISGLSQAWLAGEEFLTMPKPEMEGVTAAAVDSALVLFVDTTKDTIVEDIRGLTPMLSAALAVSKLQQGGNLSDIVDQLAAAASTPEIKSLIMSVGVGIVADELGLYSNKEEIYDAYAEALAALSQTELTEEELCREIEALNDKYAISMTEAEIAALAASLIDNPYSGSLAGEPSLMHPAATPMIVPCTVTSFPVFEQLSTEMSFEEWLAQLSTAAAEKEESLSWLSEKKEIPSELVTGEDLQALTTKEALADLGDEEMKSLFNAVAQIMEQMSSEEGLKVEETIGTLGNALGQFAATESGKALVNTLVTGALQSDTVCESMGITPGQATTIANSIKESGSLEDLGQTAKDVSNLMNVIGHLKDGSASAGESVSPEDFHTLISTMNDSSAALLRSLCTPDMMKKAGLPAESAQGAAHLLDDLLDGLVKARKNWTEEAYQKEADALYRILQLAVGAKNGSGNTFEERFGMTVEQLIETVQASELLTTVLPDSIDELYAENSDALGLSTRLDADDRALLLEKIEEYKQTADEGGDELLDALARMLG